MPRAVRTAACGDSVDIRTRVPETDRRIPPSRRQAVSRSVSATALSDFDPLTLADRFRDWGENPRHARSVLQAYYRGIGAFDALAVRPMLSGRLRARLAAEIPQRQSTVLRRQQSADGTTKLLIGLRNGGAVEAVLMPGHRPGVAAGCVSAQIGCAMGCGFCASTLRGFERNLTAGEIVEQFLRLQEAAAAIDRRVRTLVFMGMGEPLLNLDGVVGAIRRLTEPGLIDFGSGHITVSTVGIVPGIDALAVADLGVHLALSLHAPNDDMRARLVPMNRVWPVAEILAAARRYQDRVGRITNVEYCLLGGINDSEAQADELATCLGDFRAHVNLIPWNPIDGGAGGQAYRRPEPAQVRTFLGRLRERGVVAHIRETRGDDVAAACGQLRETALRESALSPADGAPSPSGPKIA